MTLVQIMRLALRQLDEDVADLAEYRDLFVAYANQGYQIALTQYVKPRETMALATDDHGDVSLDGLDILRVVAVRDEDGREVMCTMDADGMTMHTPRKDSTLYAVCEVRRRELEQDADEPQLPLEAHAALADYICYRHLSSGNLAKQSRAQHYRNEFYAQMQRLSPRPSGGVTGYKNFYTVTDSRWMM